MKHFLTFSACLVLLTRCNAGPSFANAGVGAVYSSYTLIQTNILAPKCLSCHDDAQAKGGVSFQSYSSTMSSAGSVVPYEPYQSQLYKKTLNAEMPPQHDRRNSYAPLSASELQSLYNWISLGALNN